MSDMELSRVATALRETALGQESDQGEVPEALARHVEHLVFSARALAPIERLTRRAAEHGRSEIREATLSDEDVVKLFNEQVRRMLDDFIQFPESWDDSSSELFLSQLALVLGVDREAAPRTIRLFHACPEGQRIAIFMMMEESTPFRYLSREIDDCEDDVAVQHPTQSLRNLLKAVWAD